MPARMEAALRRAAAERGLTGERADAFVYGTMRRMGWRPGQGGMLDAARRAAKRKAQTRA